MKALTVEKAQEIRAGKGHCIRPLSAAIRAAFSGQTGPY